MTKFAPGNTYFFLGIVTPLPEKNKLQFEYFFARRITFQTRRSVSGLVVRLAVLSVALAVATMEISLSVNAGFKRAIQNKVVGFGSHILIGNVLGELDQEVIPLPRNEAKIQALDSLPLIRSVSPYLTLMGIFRAEGIEEILLKGVDSTYDWTFFANNLAAGELPNLDKPRQSLEILISQKQARLLKLAPGDKTSIYFLGEPLKRRPVTISGMYETGVEEFDDLVALCDIRMLQRVLDWEEEEVSGFEVNLESVEDLDVAKEQVNEFIPYQYQATSIREVYPDLFDWLELQHQNVWLILVLMAIVAIINMTTVILILILERTQTIGILQALGLPRFRLRKLFVLNAFFLIFLGVLIGNILGLGILWSQDYWGWLQVDQENYYINVVPVAWLWGQFLLVNVGVVVLCTLFMFIPTWLITRIRPVEAIRFD